MVLIPMLGIPAFPELEIWTWDWLRLQVLKITLLEVKGLPHREDSNCVAFIFAMNAETCILVCEVSHREVFCVLSHLFPDFSFSFILSSDSALALGVVVGTAVVAIFAPPSFSFIQACTIIL